MLLRAPVQVAPAVHRLRGPRHREYQRPDWVRIDAELLKYRGRWFSFDMNVQVLPLSFERHTPELVGWRFVAPPRPPPPPPPPRPRPPVRPRRGRRLRPDRAVPGAPCPSHFVGASMTFGWASCNIHAMRPSCPRGRPFPVPSSMTCRHPCSDRGRLPFPLTAECPWPCAGADIGAAQRFRVARVEVISLRLIFELVDDSVFVHFLPQSVVHKTRAADWSLKRWPPTSIHTVVDRGMHDDRPRLEHP